MEPTHGVASRAESAAEVNLGDFPTWMRRATSAQKNAALYALLHDQLGPRVDQEFGVYDPDEFLYAVVISPGQREAFRYLETPGLLDELRCAALVPTIPIDVVHQELRIAEDLR